MDLKRNFAVLEELEIEVPALVESKEGKLLGGFCTIETCGFDIFAMQDGCENGCQNGCNDSCQIGTCQNSCKDKCQNECKSGCQVSPAPTKDTTPTKLSASLIGFSFMF